MTSTATTTGRQMATRCALCGQFTAGIDRDAMLDSDRWEGAEALVDEARTDAHLCVDTDPYGARWMDRLAATGQFTQDLAELIRAALARKQAGQAAAAPCGACGHPKSDHMGSQGRGLCITCYPSCSRWRRSTEPAGSASGPAVIHVHATIGQEATMTRAFNDNGEAERQDPPVRALPPASEAWWQTPTGGVVYQTRQDAAQDAASYFGGLIYVFVESASRAGFGSYGRPARLSDAKIRELLREIVQEVTDQPGGPGPWEACCLAALGPISELDGRLWELLGRAARGRAQRGGTRCTP